MTLYQPLVLRSIQCKSDYGDAVTPRVKVTWTDWEHSENHKATA